MRVLFLSRWFPYPPDNGSKIRIFNLIKGLAAQHAVHLISFASEPVSDERLSTLRRYCEQVETVQYRSFQPGSWKALQGFFSPRPRSVEDTFNADMQAHISRSVQVHAFDVVIASEIDMTGYAVELPIPVKIFEDPELTVVYEQFIKAGRAGRKLRSGLTWWKLSNYVAGLLRGFDGCTVVSEIERECLQQVSPGYRSIGVVPNGVDVDALRFEAVTPELDTLIYNGSLTYSANFDAVEHFLQEIYPRLLVERPNVKFLVTGKLEGVPVERLPRYPGVTFTGYLGDIRPALARSWASVVPLRLGGGTRLKILEAMALGTPVIATRKGAEGLAVVPDRDLLIADAPAEFAAQTLRLLGDADLRQRLRRSARRLVETQYDWATISQRFNAFVEQVAERAASA